MHKSEQRGAIVLALILFIIFLLNTFLPKIIKPKDKISPGSKQDIQQFVSAQKQLSDSLKFIRLQHSGKLDYKLAVRFLHPFSFDPNTVSPLQMKQMGLNARQIKNIVNYRRHKGHFFNKSDLNKIYGFSKAEIKILTPYVSINTKNLKKEKHSPSPNTTFTSVYPPLEINSCDSASLVKQLHFPPWLAARTIKYRRYLGGFYSRQQLKEVYGMKTETLKKIIPCLLLDTSMIHKIDLNRAQFKTILHHPYIDYKTTKKLISKRNTLHGFNSLDQLKALHIFPDSIFDKIRHYLYIRPLKKIRHE